MANYSIEIESYMPVDSVDHVLMNCNWIKAALLRAGYSIDDYHFESNFEMGELSCTCKSEEELRKETLGQNVEFFSILLMFFQKKDTQNICFFMKKSDMLNKRKNISINCDDKTMLSIVVENLRHLANEKNDAFSNSVEIHAEGANSSNIIVGSSNSASIEKPPEAKKSFWKEIWAGLLQNIFWAILVALILLVLAFLGIKQPDWLKF